MHSISELEQLVIEKITPDLERQGYKLILEYKNIIPGDVRGYEPDAVAQKGEKFIAIEVKKRRNANLEKSLALLKERIEANENWEFRIYFADDELDYKSFPKPEPDLVKRMSRESREASTHGLYRAAFLLSWATLEAAARASHPRIFSKPQSPSRIITVLAERGILTSDEAIDLRTLSLNRNLLIHGRFDVNVTPDDVDYLLRTASKVSGISGE